MKIKLITLSKIPVKLLGFALVVFVLQSCGFGSEATKPKVIIPIHTLVFLDKTQSVNVNKDFVHDKYSRLLRNIVDENMRNHGDRLELYFIHENTSKARALNLTVRSEREDLAGANATDQEANETAFQMALQKEKSMFLKQMLLKLDQSNVGSSNQSTDIWASLPIIAKASESDASVRVFYFSDMIESVKGVNRRDFHIKPPVSKTEAENDAKVDFQQLQQYAIGNPEVTIVSPFEPTASSRENNPNILHYWQTLFHELGGVGVEEL